MDKIDLYARDFNFTIKKRNKIISRFGVFLSLITIAIVIASFFAFGRNFIYKKNPLILKSVVYPSNKQGIQIDIQHNNMVQFPFRLKLNNGKTYVPKNFEFKISSVIVNSTTEDINRRSKIIKNSPCKKALIEIPAFVNNYNISYWNCIDFESSQIKDQESFNFIGSLSDPIFRYLKIELFCIPPKAVEITKNVINPNLNKSNIHLNSTSLNSSFNNSLIFNGTSGTMNDYNDIQCNQNEVDMELSQQIFFEYLYPESYVHPNQSPDPFTLSYFSHSIELNIGVHKTMQNYLSYDMAFDDVGWILEDKRPFRQFNTPYFRSDSTHLEWKNFGSQKSPLVSLEIIALKEYTLYNRIYMKMQEVAAQIGGLLNTFHVFFQLLVYFITDNMKSVLINELFDNENRKKKMVFKKNKRDSTIQVFNPSVNNNNANIFQFSSKNHLPANQIVNTQQNLNTINDYVNHNNNNLNPNNINQSNNNLVSSGVNIQKEYQISQNLSGNLIPPISNCNANNYNLNTINNISNNNNNMNHTNSINKPVNTLQNSFKNLGIHNNILSPKLTPQRTIPKNLVSSNLALNNVNNIKNNYNININNNFNNSNMPPLGNHQLGLNNSMNNSHLLNNFVKPMNSRLTKTKKDIIYQKYQRKKTHLIEIGFLDNFKRRFCYSLYDKKKTNLKNYDIMCDYIDSRLDIIFYFKNLISTEKFKTFFLNEHEMRSFDYMSKLNVYEIEEEMEIKKQDYYKFLDYFCDKLNQKGLKPYDEKIFNMMSDDILLEINNFNMGS